MYTRTPHQLDSPLPQLTKCVTGTGGMRHATPTSCCTTPHSEHGPMAHADGLVSPIVFLTPPCPVRYWHGGLWQPLCLHARAGHPCIKTVPISIPMRSHSNVMRSQRCREVPCPRWAAMHLCAADPHHTSVQRIQQSVSPRPHASDHRSRADDSVWRSPLRPRQGTLGPSRTMSWR